MTKITLNNVGSLIDATTAASTINNNFNTIKTAFDNTLSRDGTSPNQMGTTLDMNSSQIINLPNPATADSPLRLQDLSDFIGGGTIGSIPAGGTTNQVLSKTDNIDYHTHWANSVTSVGLVLPADLTVTGSPVTTAGTLTGAWATTPTGSGAMVRATSPTLVTPALGTPSSGVATNLTGTASGLTAGNVTTNANLTGDVTSVGNATTLTNAPVIAKVLTGYVSGAGTVSASDSILSAIQKLNGNNATNANLTGPITSVGNATSVAAQTGTGSTFVMNTSPTLVTPNLGTPTAAVLTSATGTASGLTAGNVTTNANLTGVITSVGNATSIASQTGTGTKFVVDTSPTLVTPNLGTPSAVVLTNATGTATSLTAGTVTTNANLTGPITSSGNATAIASQTGTGTKFVVDASPTLTGTPLSTTAAVDTNTTQIATTAYVVAQAASATPLINGTATVGTSTRFARGDHIHPTDTTRAPTASPTFTGTVTVPTPFTVGATSVTSTGTQLNYLNAATGTTGTTSTNVVFSTSPTLVTPTLGAATATSVNKVAITAPATSATLTIADGTTLTETTSTSVGKGQYLATSTNDDATAGNIGEYASGTASAAAIVSSTPTTITSVSLTAGDWDIQFTTKTNTAAATTVAQNVASISTTTNTLDVSVGNASERLDSSVAPGTGFNVTNSTPTVRKSLSGTTTIYGVAYIVYGVSTLTLDGFIRARRVR